MHKKFMCSNNDTCDLSTGNRTACKSCRYQKCLQVGMTLQGQFKANLVILKVKRNGCFMIEKDGSLGKLF